MDEEFDSLIVTDPDLVDPGIDVSGLRTQTDTSLLGNIPDFAGIQYEAFNPNRLSDLMRLYSTGLPAVDTPVDVTPPSSGGGSGGGGQAITPTNSITDGTNINTPGGLTQSGTFGGQPTFTTTPGTTVDDVTGNITNPDGSYGGNINDEVALTGGQPTTPVDNTIQIENISADPYSIPMDINDPGASIENLAALQTPSQTTSDLKNISDLPMVQTSTDAQGNIYSMREEDYGSYLGNINDEVALTGGGTPEQQEGFLQNVLGKAGQTVTGALTELGKIPGAVVDTANQTVDVFGKKLNVGKTLASLAINKLAGGPISLVFDVLGAITPEFEPTFTQRTLTDELGLTDDRKFSGDPTTSAFAGLNAFGQFGDPVETAKDRIDTRLENIENKNYKPGDKFYDDTQTMIEEYNRVTNKLGDIDAIPTGDAQIAEETIGTLPEITEARQEQGEQIQEIQQQEVVQSGSDEADRQQRDTGVAKVSENRYETKSGDVYASASEAAEKSDGGDRSSGKIVCTMMNESYGFGSFRNKIWLKHSKGLSPEYQKGYHKIFLPLVRLSKNNKILKKMLEHIAVHRTIDIRQESRGKVHLLGRIYRKIFEPICYWVGKYAK